ncbi:hypothetical protein XA68_16711 [Ophiocordyceps unilateralis]|uniref:Uncharacterized protein n=1 Tax=Ophiocordyceps unilateralis TaxID=268505 RepID=A0A2A9P4G5_OPHUN|nr:hypothetical protein XA68_16711 [Ophiocordyceps unilateralis]
MGPPMTAAAAKQADSNKRPGPPADSAIPFCPPFSTGAPNKRLSTKAVHEGPSLPLLSWPGWLPFRSRRNPSHTRPA